MMNMPVWMAQTVQQIEQGLQAALVKDTMIPKPLLDAMRHSLLAGGKRIRPLLLLTACEAMGGQADQAMPYSLALEMIHTYSLVHDDLPAMDDDDLRRGRPTCHKVYGEGMAVLAGDGLLSLAFELMGDAAANAPLAQMPNHTQALASIAHGCGVNGMVAGQCIDLEGENKHLDAAALEAMYDQKTGALLRCAVQAGAHLAGADRTEIDALGAFALHLGLWFQINDDILDVEADPQIIGKPVGSDQRQGKSTFVSMLGLDEAKNRREQQRVLALNRLGVLGTRSARLCEAFNWLCDGAK